MLLSHVDPGYYDWKESVFRCRSGCPKLGVATDFIVIIIITYLSLSLFRSKCETIRLKLNCLELEIKHSTYSKDAIKAIRFVSFMFLNQFPFFTL